MGKMTHRCPGCQSKLTETGRRITPSGRLHVDWFCRNCKASGHVDMGLAADYGLGVE